MAINKTLNNIFKGDKVIWMVFLFLFLISIIEVFSASSELTYKSGNFWWPMIKHTMLFGVGIFLMVVVLNIQCRYFKVLVPVLLPVSFLMLLWVTLFGETTNDAARWISILGIQFQPSEIAKGALILATAKILSELQTDKGADSRAFSYILVIAIPIVGLIFLENFSTAVLLFAVIILMMFIGHVPLGQLGRLLGIIALAAMLGLSAIMMFGQDRNDTASRKGVKTEEVITAKATDGQTDGQETRRRGLLHRLDTWKGRIDKFLNSEDVPPREFDLDRDAQVGHSNIAIASSNVIGKGPGNSVERDFLPQAFSDFIYAIIVEEMGIEGAAFVALLYIILLFRTGRIASRCENNFPAFLAMGLALMLVIQALFNMLVAVGLAPVTGQPLPLVSKGGTTTIINCMYLGVILSISRTAKKRERPDTAKTTPTTATA